MVTRVDAVDGQGRVLAMLSDLVLSRSADDGRLPPERELAKLLGIGRPAIREYLQALEMLGLVRRDQGRGTFITPPDGAALGSVLDLALVAGHVTAEDLSVVRRRLEREAARLATGHVDCATLDRLRALTETMRTCPSAEEAAEADRDFHLALISCSGNGALAFIAAILSEALRRRMVEMREAIHSIPRGQAEMARAHAAIIKALESGARDGAARAIDNHFATYDRLARRIERARAGR